MNYLDASIRGIKFQKKNKFQIPNSKFQKNEIRCKHRGNELPRCKHPRYQIPQKKQIPNSKKKIKYDASIGELNPKRLKY